MDALLKVIDPNQLTPDLEGTLQYDHASWIELRCVSSNNFSMENRILENNYPFRSAF